MSSYWVGFAFLRGDYHVMNDRMVMYLTNGPYVHVELLISDGGQVHAFSSYINTNKGFIASPNSFENPRWDMVILGLKNKTAHDTIWKWIQHTLQLNLKYNSKDLWLCWANFMLGVEKDFSYKNIDSWVSTGVFCSQVALLFTRRMIQCDFITNIHEDTVNMIFKTNSRGCSPNHLFKILNLGYKQLPQCGARMINHINMAIPSPTCWRQWTCDTFPQLDMVGGHVTPVHSFSNMGQTFFQRSEIDKKKRVCQTEVKSSINPTPNSSWSQTWISACKMK